MDDNSNRTTKRRDQFKTVHTSCPCGTSSDAYCVRHDGSGFCFSCHKDFQDGVKEIDKGNQVGHLDVTYDIVGHRSIARKTFEFYDVRTKFVDEEADSVAFPYGKGGMKIRLLDQKKFRTLGNFQEAGLFGQDKFDPGSKESITICEGEFDALAIYEMLKGKTASVSLKSGAGSAFADCRRSYDYINSFDKIYLCFDNDLPGQNAIKSLQGLFDFKKVYLVKLNRRKDANEYLEHHEADDFWKTWHGAKRFTPDNIISSFSEIEAALNVSEEDRLGEYPFAGLNERLYGLHAGEIIVVKAMEGVGKTEFFRSLEYNILKTTNHPIGIIHLEEDNGTTVKAIAGYELEVPAVLPDCGLSQEDILRGYKKAVRDDEGRIHIHSSFDVEDENAFLGNIRFLVSAAGCRFIFLDHISWLATGTDDEDERRKLDRVSQKLKLLAKELRFCLVMISHVNDDGKTRGSRNISKVANTVISLDRNILDDSTRTYFVIEKARLGGRTGRAGAGVFDRGKGKLLPEEDQVLEDGSEEDKKGKK